MLYEISEQTKTNFRGVNRRVGLSQRLVMAQTGAELLIEHNFHATLPDNVLLIGV